MMPLNVPVADRSLNAYYADRRLLRRNVLSIMTANLGWAACTSVVWPLMLLRMNGAGVSEGVLGVMTSANAWAVSFLVMYFSWKSDHLVSRWGRRIPFLMIATPFILLSIVLFPLAHSATPLLSLTALYLFFMDMKASTFPLLSIDCVPRDRLARIGALMSIVTMLCSFAALRYGMRLSEWSESLPYFLGAALMALTAGAAVAGVREPPIHNPTTERFRPWSAIRVGWRDRRAVILMAGVATVQGLLSMYNAWLWLYAKNALGLSRADTGLAVSWSLLLGVVLAYPVGWVIDRCGSYRVIAAFWLLQVAAFVMMLNVRDGRGLMWLSLLTAATLPLYQAADMLVYKSAAAEDVGSITSTNAFVRNAWSGVMLAASGFLIQSTRWGYHAAFVLGIAASTLGLALLLIYRGLSRRGERVPRTLDLVHAE